MNTQLSREIREKRTILRSMYGGMMTLEELTGELGYKSPKSTRKWVAENELPATRVSNGARDMTRYETDLVAKKIVEARGMTA